MSIKETILDAIKDSDNRVSTIRVIVLTGVIIILLTWVGFCIWHGKLEDIPTGVSITIGTLVGGKVVQAGLDNK